VQAGQAKEAYLGPENRAKYYHWQSQWSKGRIKHFWADV